MWETGYLEVGLADSPELTALGNALRKFFCTGFFRPELRKAKVLSLFAEGDDDRQRQPRSPRKSGRRPIQLERAKAAMLKWQREGKGNDLSDVTLEFLMSQFDIKHDLARRARKAVLSEMSAAETPANSEQPRTISNIEQ